MRLQKSVISKASIVPIAANGLVLSFGIFALVNLFSSGVLPVKYAILASIVFIVIAVLTIFLSFHSFRTRKRSMVILALSLGRM